MKSAILHTTNCSMPTIGLGTWQAKPDEIENVVTAALDAGYRHIDTAFTYGNETPIGKAIDAWLLKNNVKRDELFITTKLPHIGTRARDVEKFLKMSLKNLNLDYVDLYLVHVPFGFLYDENTLNPLVNENGEYRLDLETDHVTLWKAMEAVMGKGLTKNIGLSNFNQVQINNICLNCSIRPQVLQIECHAYLQQKGLRSYCNKNNIAVVAYSPLGNPNAKNHFLNKYQHTLKNTVNILEDPTVNKIAVKYGKSAGQIALRFLVQNNVSVIPKSSNPGRIKENTSMLDFELDQGEMEELSKLDKGEKGRIINFFVWKGVEKHPCYPFLIDN